MNWSRVDKYCERSDAGYKVAAMGGADGWKFAAARPMRSPEPVERIEHGEVLDSPLLGVFDTAEEARTACEMHAKEAPGA